MAGIGLALRVIESDIFGVAVMMTIVTTVIAPIILVPVFGGGKLGIRTRSKEASDAPRA